MRPRFLIPVLALALLAAYWRVWTFGLVYDDLNWVGKPIQIHADDWSYWARLPWVFADWIGHGRPWAYHGLIICLHLVNGLLLYQLARYVLNERASLITLALFWLWPSVNTEAVAYISGGIEVLLTTYLLLALLSALNGGWSGLIGAWICLFFAMTLKFSALPMLLIIPALVSVRKGWHATWFMPIILVGAFVVARPALASVGALQISLVNAQHVSEALWRYLAFIPWPSGFSIEHDWWSVNPIWGWSAMGATVLACILAWCVRDAWPLAGLACFVIVASLLPRIFVPEMPPLTEHHCYSLFLPVWMLCGQVIDCLLSWHPAAAAQMSQTWLTRRT